MNPEDIRLISNEIERQYQLFGDQSAKHPYEHLAIITEEFRELAEVITETYANGRHPERGGFENLIKEAVHIAASAISFLDCIRKNFDETGTKKGTAGFRST